jgi:hypothetical protein
MDIKATVMTRGEALAMLRNAKAYRRQMRAQAANKRLPANERYAAAVYIDSWEEMIEDVEAYLRMLGTK